MKNFRSFLKSGLFLLVISFISLSLTNCSLFKGNDSKSYKKVTISDPGEIYSTFGLADDEDARKAILANGVSYDMFKKIADNSEEGAWPATMKTLDGRLDNRENIMKYNVRLVTKFDDKCVIVVPAKENKHMPSGMQSKDDFYIIIGQSGIQE